ncbi:hypothetical protein ABPG73_006216 [Tetrahymena malaccensis]
MDALLQECGIMKEVKSQFVIQIEAILKIDDFLCILMEYADQGTLETFISNISNQTVSINANQILDLACDIFQGLNILHTKKVIHRDLKMQNLLVSNYQIKIADLGVATYLISKSYAQTNVGNLLYAAPEKNYEKYNSAIDIFSAGLIILQLMTGLSSYEVIKLKANHSYSNQIQDSPESLKIFLEQLLEKNPESRPDASSAYNLCRALKYNQEVLNYINNRINSNTPHFSDAKNVFNYTNDSSKQKSLSTAVDSGLNKMEEEELFEKGMELFWTTDLIQAEKCFSLIMQKNPLSVNAICGRLLCGFYFSDWINMKQYSKQWQQDQLQLIEQLNPNNYMYYLCLAILNQDLDSINQCISLNPQLVEAIAWKASQLIRENAIQEAIECGQQALEMDGNNPFVLRNLGFIYLSINKDISEKFYLRSLQSNLNQYIALYQLGMIHKDKIQLDEALYYFKESLSICPYHKSSIQEMLNIMLKKQQYKEIINYIEKLFQQFGELDFLYFTLASSYQKIGDSTKSLLYYSKSLLYEEDGQVLNNIGEIYQQQKDYEKAQEYFQRAIDQNCKQSFVNMYELLKNNLDSEQEAEEYLDRLQKYYLDEDSEEDCVYKILTCRLLKQYSDGLDFYEQIQNKYSSSKAINQEMLKLISQEDYTEDLHQQYKISEQIQKREGISYESTMCQVKYFSSNEMYEIVVVQILNYFEDIAHKEQTLKEKYRFSFEEYINQDQIEKIFIGMKKICQNNPNNIHCQLYFLNLIQLDFEFTETMIEDFKQTYNKCNQLFNEHPDKQLIQLLRIEYLSQMQYYLFTHDSRLQLFQYEELKDILKMMDEANREIKERFQVFHIGYNDMLGIAIEAAEKLNKSQEEIADIYECREEKYYEAIEFFPNLKDLLNCEQYNFY